MKRRQYLFVLAIVCIFLVAAVVGVKMGVWHQAADSAKPVVGSPAPNFTLPELNGKKIALKSIISKNKVTVLNFWATWCQPCKAEIPEFVKFYQKYASKGVTVLAVNVRDQPANVKSFVAKAGMKFPVLMDTSGKIGDLYQIFSIPSTFFIDNKGIIRSIIKGGTKLTTLEQNVQSLLKGK